MKNLRDYLRRWLGIDWLWPRVLERLGIACYWMRLYDGYRYFIGKSVDADPGGSLWKAVEKEPTEEQEPPQ